MYVKGRIGPVDGIFLIDTGSSDTLLSSKVWQSIPMKEKPQLKALTTTSEQADGSPLSLIGCADMEIRVGTACAVMTVTVADISSSGIIGMDYLEATNCKINIAGRELIMNDEIQVPCVDSNSRSFCARITTREKVTIPALHEVIIFGKVNDESVLGESIREQQSKAS